MLCSRSINSLAYVLQRIWLPTDAVPGGGRSRDCVQDQHTRTRGANRLWLLQHQRHKQGGPELFHVVKKTCIKKLTLLISTHVYVKIHLSVVLLYNPIRKMYDRICEFYENSKSVITTHLTLALFKGDPDVRESEGSLLRTGHDQWGATDHHVTQPAIL